MSSYNKLVLHALAMSAGNGKGIMGEIEIALGLKPDLKSQFEAAETPEQCQALIDTAPDESFRRKTERKRDDLLDDRLIREVKKADTPADIEKIRKKYPDYLSSGQSFATEKRDKLLSDDLLPKLAAATTMRQYERIYEQAPGHTKAKEESARKFNAELAAFLEKAKTAKACKKIRDRILGYDPGLEARVLKKETGLEALEIKRKIPLADTQKKCVMLLGTISYDRFKDLHEEVRMKGHNLFYAKLEKQFEPLQTLEDYRKKLASYPNPDEIKRYLVVQETYDRLVGEECKVKALTTPNLRECLAHFKIVSRKIEASKVIWEHALTLFSDPAELPAMLEAAGAHTPEAYAALKKAADMLLEKQELVAV